MEIRKITEAEREQILLGDRYAYGNWTEDEITPSSLETVIPDQTFAGFDYDGKIVAALRIHSFQQVVRGVVKEMGGIGGVWTYPENRNQGYVRELLKAAFRDMQAKGQSVSMLIPFKESFYHKFDYVTANSNIEVRIPMDTLVEYFANKEESFSWSLPEFERINASAARSEFFSIHNSLQGLGKPHHGMVLPTYWTSAQWQEAVKDQQCVLYGSSSPSRKEHPTSIAMYKIDSKERTIHVDHSYWLFRTPRNKLFEFFASHQGQIDYVCVNLPFGANFNQWFGDIAGKYEISVKTNPFMVRVIDLVGAINDIPTKKDGVINIEIDDPQYTDKYYNSSRSRIAFEESRSDTFVLESQDYKLNIKPSPDTKPTIKFTVQGISALVYGTLSLAELEYKEWIIFVDYANSDEVRSLLESWFPPIPIYNTWRF